MATSTKQVSIKSFDHRTRATQKLLELGGAVMSSNWVRGSGRYVSMREIPPFCDKSEINHARKTCDSSKVRECIDEILDSNPRCRFVVYVDDWSGYQSERIKASETKHTAK